jgi:hypothetical protein
MRRTELHAKATGFAALDDDRNTSFCHEIPQIGAAITPKFNCGGCDYGGKKPAEGVMVVTQSGEGEHDAI